jgi:tRNA-dihydrouridine synthase
METSKSSLDDQSICEKVILAPMVRGSELAFRTMIRRYGVTHCFSPMLRAAEVVKAFQIWKERDDNGNYNTDLSTRVTHEDGILLLTDICGKNIMATSDSSTQSSSGEGILTVQLCGCCPEKLYSATRVLMQLQLTENLQLHGIDLNLGCPQKCAQDGCFGAFLAENQPQLALECVAAMRRAIDSFEESTSSSCRLDLPRLSCKIRLLETDDETISFAKNLQMAGCEILALHCRRRIEKHNGKPNLDAGKKVVNALSIPVVINGSEANSLKDVAITLEKTQAHSVMIARDFLTNPRMLIQENADPAFLAAEYLDCCERYPPPSALYIQKHLRWIFRKYLQPERKMEEKDYDYNDWRLRLWTFLARPFLETIYQFRQFVALYVKFNGSELPASLSNQPEPSFKSIRQYRDQTYDSEEGLVSEVELEKCQTEVMVNLFQ